MHVLNSRTKNGFSRKNMRSQIIIYGIHYLLRYCPESNFQRPGLLFLVLLSGTSFVCLFIFITLYALPVHIIAFLCVLLARDCVCCCSFLVVSTFLLFCLCSVHRPGSTSNVPMQMHWTELLFRFVGSMASTARISKITH